MGKNKNIFCGDGLYNLIVSRRSVRKFKKGTLSLSIMKKLVNAARLAPSAANLQFLEYLVVTRKRLCSYIFPHTRWAGYLYPDYIPKEGERPSAYIILLINKHRSSNPDRRDVGAAAENILLSALCFGLGGCWLASIDRDSIRRILNIPSYYEIDSLIALGEPAEDPIVEEDERNVKYYLDRKWRLHVPKRPLKSVCHFNRIEK